MALNSANNFKITTPHAAVIVWNYDDRLGADPSDLSTLNEISTKIISTVSCMSIQTTKSKSNPAGNFQIVLAPTKNWVAELTAGSWCAILMSNEPITQDQLTSADARFVKMFGKIEGVRAEVAVDEEGARHTRYLVSGTDWGDIFNSTLYVDNLIAAANDPVNLGNTIALALYKSLFGDGNSPIKFNTADLLVQMMGIFGATTSGSLAAKAKAINRLDKSVYDFLIPTEMVQYFNFLDGDGNPNQSNKLSDLLGLQVGRLSDYDTYEDTNESYGYIDPFSLQGTNSFWQVLIENSNPTINEMYNEIDWEDDGTGNLAPSLTVFNRIKPFSYRAVTSSAAAAKLRSPFNLIKAHFINSVKVMNVSAGTNWKDKYNFIEVRPQFSDLKVIEGWTAQKSQGSDPAAFNREGFRPLILGSKQFPVDPTKEGAGFLFAPDMVSVWVDLLKEWYFDTHRMLNGTLTMQGTTEYIGVGNNIMFDAGLINPTSNFNQDDSSSVRSYILAHVESVEHTFNVGQDGARVYATIVRFVRGILVDENKQVIGNGSLDQLSSDMDESQYINSANTVTMSDNSDPDV